jgi:hypothetical protein
MRVSDICGLLEVMAFLERVRLSRHDAGACIPVGHFTFGEIRRGALQLATTI